MSAPHRLSESIRDAVVERDNERFISAASAWEIAIKQRLGKLSFPLDRFAEQVAALAAQVLSITPAHGIAAGALPLHHRDPFDRMLIAQARTEGLVLVTSDMSIARYDVALLSQQLRQPSGSVMEAPGGAALAGVAPDRTRVKIWADPAVDRNIHTIRVEAEAARLTMTIENVPSVANPRTGKITPVSVLACLRGLVSTLKVGS